MRAIRIRMNPGNPDQPEHLTQMVEIRQDDITVPETLQWLGGLIGNQKPVFYRSSFLKEIGMPESWVIISGENGKRNKVATYLAGGKEILGDALFINLHGEIDSGSEYWFEAITSWQSSELIPELVNYCVLADQGKLERV